MESFKACLLISSKNYLYSIFIRVTSVAGHVYNRDFPMEFQDRRSDSLKLFDAPTVRKLDR